MFGNIRGSLQRHAHECIESYLDVTYQQVPLRPGKGMFNNKCHLVSCQEATTNIRASVVMGAVVVNGRVIAHFVNKIGDEYVDNTLGCTAPPWFYEAVTIPPCDYGKVDYYLFAMQQHLTRQVPWWVRQLIDISV